jgi:carboxylesterase
VFRNRARSVREQKMMGSGPVEVFADGHAPCVVALHGFGGTAAEIKPLVDAIATAGFAVDAALLAGHGARVEQLQETGFDAWVDGASRRLLEARRRYGRVVLLGFSLGSLVAMQLAAEDPEALAGLVVLGNALTLAGSMNVPFSIWARTGWPIPDAYLLKPTAGDAVDPAALRMLVTYDRHPLKAAYEVYRAGPRVRAAVGRITCPALILHGRRDHVCSWRNARWLAEHIGSRDVSVRIFERSAHVLACDGERAEVAREVVAFVKRVAGEG